jgi:hypothetical protein
MSLDTFDVLAWANDLARKLPLYQSVDLLRADWSDHKDALKARDPEVFRAVNYAIVERAAAIEGRA